MWNPTTREQYTRTAARYETDLTDAEWAVIAPHMPPPAKRGRPRDWTFREIMNGIFYILRGGIPWRLMPTDLRMRGKTPGKLPSGGGVVEKDGNVLKRMPEPSIPEA